MGQSAIKDFLGSQNTSAQLHYLLLQNSDSQIPIVRITEPTLHF